MNVDPFILIIVIGWNKVEYLDLHGIQSKKYGILHQKHWFMDSSSYMRVYNSGRKRKKGPDEVSSRRRNSLTIRSVVH